MQTFRTDPFEISGSFAINFNGDFTEALQWPQSFVCGVDVVPFALWTPGNGVTPVQQALSSCCREQIACRYHSGPEQPRKGFWPVLEPRGNSVLHDENSKATKQSTDWCSQVLWSIAQS